MSKPASLERFSDEYIETAIKRFYSRWRFQTDDPGVRAHYKDLYWAYVKESNRRKTLAANAAVALYGPIQGEARHFSDIHRKLDTLIERSETKDTIVNVFNPVEPKGIDIVGYDAGNNQLMVRMPDGTVGPFVPPTTPKFPQLKKYANNANAISFRVEGVPYRPNDLGDLLVELQDWPELTVSATWEAKSSWYWVKIQGDISQVLRRLVG